MKHYFVCLLLFIAGTHYSQQIDVWDFGGVSLDPSLYTNQLDVEAINSWYDASITPGTSGINLPTSFTSGVLSWVGNASDRLRTSNTNLTRFDTNIASVATFTGRIYCNGSITFNNGLPNNRYLRLLLGEDDEVSVIVRGDTNGDLVFANETNPTQQSTFPIPSTSGAVVEAKFVAQTPGYYRIYEPLAKVSFYRVLRKDAVYTQVTGAIDLTQASGINAGYQLVFTNVAGKSWTAAINSNSYEVTVPVGYTYEVSLENANGYIISSGGAFSSVGVSSTVTHDVAISGVNLITLTGAISGLGNSIDALDFVFNPQGGSVFVPQPDINQQNSNYSVQLEAGVAYTIDAFGVNDFDLNTTMILISLDSEIELHFSPKPLFPVQISLNGLNTIQGDALSFTFENLNEVGYQYTFDDIDSIFLRNGTYRVTASGLDLYPIQLALTSNLNVNNSPVSKSLSFIPIKIWTFDEQMIQTTTTTYYRGLELNGQITTVINPGHLTAKTGSTLIVPIEPGEKLVVSYYFSAHFTIEGGPVITTSSGSTNLVETTTYVYGEVQSGSVTIQVGGPVSLTTYIKEIKVVPNAIYTPELMVGVDKPFQTIHQALEWVNNMNRTDSERVTILIDPGNYEEMLVITQPNITLKNASLSPSIDIFESGVDIHENAVRITSYYGHGYHYYSMGSNQKWNQEVLHVNLQNGSFSHPNAGAGTTNGSFWNATVVVRANGFEAEHIIFENSFNQYVSLKESQDVVVAWESGSPGVRPTTFGNTAVQNRILVERAAALAVVNNTDKVIFNRCKVIGRQDTFFGGNGARVVVYKGAVLGAVDYIFGGMNAVFYQTQLVMNTSDASNDIAYIAAPQQSSGRGYLMYECTVTSTTPVVETASIYRSKPGYFGRPWLANTSEAVFYATTIETSNYPGFIDQSLIRPLGWLSTLGGTSPGMYEFGTIELSGVNNGPSRAGWATLLENPILNDGTSITPFQFTKGNDQWDPLPNLIVNDQLSIVLPSENPIIISGIKDTLYLLNVQESTQLSIFHFNGQRYLSQPIQSDTIIALPSGIWIIKVEGTKGVKTKKISTLGFH
jgi:pectin methylesterase-like acyl-CoA thioesterase